MGNKGVCLLVQNCPICHPNGSVNKKLYPISNCNPLINWNHSKKYWLVENWDRGTKYIVCGFNFVNTLTKGGYEIILIKHYPNTYTEKANLVILDSLDRKPVIVKWTRHSDRDKLCSIMIMLLNPTSERSLLL